MLDIYISNPVIIYLFLFLETAKTLHIDFIKHVHTIAFYSAYTNKNKVHQKPVKLG